MPGVVGYQLFVLQQLSVVQSARVTLITLGLSSGHIVYTSVYRIRRAAPFSDVEIVGEALLVTILWLFCAMRYFLLCFTVVFLRVRFFV